MPFLGFWIREIAGWLLVLLGLFMMYMCLTLLLSQMPLIFEAAIMAPISIIVFRGGIHLLKVAVAARIWRHMPVPVANLIGARLRGGIPA